MIKSAFLFFQAGFIGVMGPFVFFNLTKTKYMQIVTSFTRWLGE